jgi:hypothetical protein
MKAPFFKGNLLADLVDMDSPTAILDEVLFIMTIIHPQMDPTRLTNAFSLMVSLYHGQWPRERECNTDYHDLRHVTDTMLAMARLIHGVSLAGKRINPGDIYTGMVAALVHDAGYIQDKTDKFGTGAKYTTTHVERSMAFVERYGQRYGLTAQQIPSCALMIKCTDLNVDVSTLQFPSRTVELLAKLLGCADLIGQMADRTYLEKLFHLHREFEEGNVSGFRDEMDLLTQTLGFFPMVKQRLVHQLGGYDELAKAHFARRWSISKNLYGVTIEKQRRHLELILAHPDRDPSLLLRRKRIVETFFKRKKGAKN